MNPYDELPAPSCFVEAIKEKKLKNELIFESYDQIESKHEEEVQSKNNSSNAKDFNLLKTLNTLVSHLMNDKKFNKASTLMGQLINVHLNFNTSSFFYEAFCNLMCECRERNVADKQFAKSYINLFEILQLRITFFNNTLHNYRILTFILYGLHHNLLITDDSFQFSKACRGISDIIQNSFISFNVTNDKQFLLFYDEDDDQNEMTQYDINIERQKVILLCIEVAGEHYHLAWARQPIDSLITILSEYKQYFDIDMIEQLNNIVAKMTLTKRKTASYSGPVTIRTYNSTAHPLSSKKAGVLR